MHSREYSDETARVIDEEVERILREQEDRARERLRRHRKGLDAVARALLENETIDGAEVGRLVDEAAGQTGRRRTARAATATAEAPPPPPANGDGDGAGAEATPEPTRSRRSR